MSQISSLLRAPPELIKDCPAITVDDVELVLAEVEPILRKSLYCVQVQLPRAIHVLLTLVLQASTSQLERISRALLRPMTEEGICLDLFVQLTRQLLHKANAIFRLAFDMEVFLELLQNLCGASALKEKLGLLLGPMLIDFMQDVTQHADDYRIHRGCASGVITLLRGCRASKNRLCAECGRVADCLERTTDFFLQMQCVEILYRLHTHNAAVLAQSRVSDAIREGVTALPNDATLLLHIQSFLDQYNMSRQPQRIFFFAALHMEVAGAEVCGPTTIYFSPLLLVVLLPGGSGNSFTIPYESIRSVKLSTEHALALRLNSIPPKLSLLMQLTEGQDTLYVYFTKSTLQQLRACSIHTWIAERKHSAPRRLYSRATARPIQNAAEVDDASTTTANAGAATDAEAQQVASTMADESRPDVAPRPLSSSRHTSAQRGASATERPTALNAYSDAGGNSIAAVERSAKSERMPDPAGAVRSALEDVHRAAAVKAARAREARLASLHAAQERVDELTAAMSAADARERDGFEASFREDMARVRYAEAELKEIAAKHVQALNAELEDVQTLGTMLKAETDKLREHLAGALGKAEGVEEGCLSRLKRLVDTDMQRMEQTLQQILANIDPDQLVTQQLAAARVGDEVLDKSQTRSKARRLEYT